MRLLQKLNQLFQRSPRLYILGISSILLLTYVASFFYHQYKPLVQGTNFTGQVHHTQVELLIDDSYVDANGKTQVSQQIFPKMLQMIQNAKTTIMIDIFLFNDLVGMQQDTQNWTEQFIYALIQKRREFKDINIYVMTDPVNSVYGGLLPKHYAQLAQAGIQVHETNLTDLRASNPTWTGFWAMCCQNVGNNASGGWLVSPFNAQDKVTLRSYLHLLNFKANHRKVMIVDSEQGWQSLISSANVHDGSSKHRNMAVLLHGAIASDVLKSEAPVAKLAGADIPALIVGQDIQESYSTQAQVLTEKAIFERAMQMIESSQKGDKLNMMMFYLSERHIIQALKQAQQRGVEIQILLDKNTNAFGREKNGIPNQPVSHELQQAGIAVKWCNTQAEQCHAKVLIKQNNQTLDVLLGSANFTRRNLQNYNLESDVWLKMPIQDSQSEKLLHYFNQAWQHAVEPSAHQSTFKYWQYRFMEWSGLSTF